MGKPKRLPSNNLLVFCFRCFFQVRNSFSFLMKTRTRLNKKKRSRKAPVNCRSLTGRKWGVVPGSFISAICPIFRGPAMPAQAARLGRLLPYPVIVRLGFRPTSGSRTWAASIHRDRFCYTWATAKGGEFQLPLSFCNLRSSPENDHPPRV